MGTLHFVLYSHSASLHPGVQMGTGEFNAWGGSGCRLCKRLAYHPGALVASCLHSTKTGNKHRPDGTPDSYADLTFTFWTWQCLNSFPSTFVLCFIADETVSHTPEGTPVSDSSNDSPYTENHALELPRSTGAPQKRAVRSLSLDAGTMTHTRLHILSCVRSVRDNIRSQISSSSPSSPVGRSMWLDG